ncbi:MAG: hypothetical protein GXY46_03530 [Actinobacteria bacterium]|nr:hypothetical protein [Actinomycetota bacterium]
MSSAQHLAQIRVQTAGFWCEGYIVVPRPGGYKGRVNDILNSSEQFIALTDVTLHERHQGAEEKPISYDVLLLRKDEIQYVVPLD